MLEYGINLDGEIIYIDDAEKQTDYICSDCKAILHVKDGLIKRKHFFHLNASDCGGTGESLIHMYWKRWIANRKEITLPKPTAIYKNRVSYDYEIYKVVQGKQEVRYLDGKYIPDVVLTLEINGKPVDVFIEVCYKNPKTDDYIEHWRALGKPVFEFKIGYNKQITNVQLLYSKKIEDRQRELRMPEIIEGCKEEFVQWKEAMINEIKPIFYYEDWNKIEPYGQFLKRVQPIREAKQKEREEYKQRYQSGVQVDIGVKIGKGYKYRRCYVGELFYILNRYAEQRPFEHWTQEGIEWRLHLPDRTIQILNDWMDEKDKYIDGGMIKNNTFISW